jgi:hypothetical protein
MQMNNFFDDWFIQESISKDKVEEIKYEIKNVISKNNIQSNIHLTSSTGNIEQYNLVNHIGQSYIIDDLSKLIFNKLQERKLIMKNNDLVRQQCWTAIGKKGAYHTVHSHNTQIMRAVVCVFYLQTPNKDQNDIHDRSGNFFMFSRRNELMEFSPKEGDYIIFPTWIYHGTYPQSKGYRQTLNIDYTILT